MVAKGDAAVFEVLNELGFKRILGIGSHGLGLGHRPLAELGFLTCEFEHLLVELLKIPFAKCRSAKVYVVVKSVLNSGTDGEQRVGVKVQNALRQHVGRGVPKCSFAFGLIPGEKHERSAAAKGLMEFYALPVPLCS